MTSTTFGDVIEGLSDDGKTLRAPVFNEHEVRAAAGMTRALGTVAFVLAFFEQVYWPIRVVATVFFLEFLVRVTVGLKYSPMGVLSRWLMHRQEPQWVSAKPKRFAWTLGMTLSLSMVVITNIGIRGVLPQTICLICLVLMWMESVLGLCMGCEIHARLVRWGWTTKDEAFEVCAHGACDVSAGARPQSTQTPGG